MIFFLQPGKLKLQNTKSKALSQPKKQTFVEWFALQKASLQTQYPDITPTELTKIGMKIFREKPAEKELKPNNADENSQISQNSETIPETQVIESKKRKIDDISEDNKNKDGKQSVSKKLSLFAFNK